MNVFQRFRIHFRHLVNMTDELDREGAAESIRSNIHFEGMNVFILACAIIIASVGLNVNSIPVIIGAMLVSPVMGPILGLGFGLGTRDNHLMVESFKNFAIMVGISIGASFLYFLLTPLHLENPTELLARTNPTLYDVLIALFGGFAGILETSRRKKGTVLSGVAIATALMPPLCTVGYGLSILNFKYVAGALYLFVINSIFIALATFLVVKYLKYPVVPEGEGSRRRLSSRAVTIILVIVIIPSIYSAFRIVRESNFNSHVQQLVSSHRTIGQSFIYDHKTNFSVRNATVEIYLTGPAVTDADKEEFFAAADAVGIRGDQIHFLQSGATATSAIESDLVKNLYQASEEHIALLSDSIARLRDTLATYRLRNNESISVAREIMVQYPEVSHVTLGDASLVDTATVSQSFVVFLTSTKPLTAEEKAKMQRWLVLRLGVKDIVIVN